MKKMTMEEVVSDEELRKEIEEYCLTNGIA